MANLAVELPLQLPITRKVLVSLHIITRCIEYWISTFVNPLVEYWY